MSESTTTNIQTLLTKIRKDYPDISFEPGERFSWRSDKRHISFQDTNNDQRGTWALLHEVGHALLYHDHYQYDIELVQLEVGAWDKASELAQQYGLHIDENYIQDCLDTYRDWLHMRATCPTCFTRSLQVSSKQYHCFNCGSDWHVSRSRLCRPYRLRITT